MGRLGLEYFYDTSAIYEYMQGNPKARSYFMPPNTGAVSLLVVLELYLILLRGGEESKANLALEKFFPLIRDPSKSLIAKAMLFKLQHKNRGLSYADAVGYAYAQEQAMPFLTLDSDFNGLPNVVFVR